MKRYENKAEARGGERLEYTLLRNKTKLLYTSLVKKIKRFLVKDSWKKRLLKTK